MGYFLALLRDNWFTLLQTTGIIGGLVFTALSFRADTKARQVDNLIRMKEQHQGLWRQLFENANLKGVLDAERDLVAEPVSEEEEFFVLSLILHLFASYRGIETGVLKSPDGLEKDICEVFEYPVPRAAWEKAREYQDADFVVFIEGVLEREVEVQTDPQNGTFV
jgi:hypothetical protein